MSTVVHARTCGSRSAIRRGVNRRATNFRIAVCCGGSMWIIEYATPLAPSSSSATPFVDVYVAGSCSPASTSSKRDSAQKSSVGLWYTGASSRSHAYVGYGSRWKS